MWQQVTADEPTLVQKAFDVLHFYNWLGSVDQLIAVLQDQAVYYYNASSYELVGSFRYHTQEGEWRLEMVGVTGTFSKSAAKHAAEKIVHFMHGKGIKSLFMVMEARDPTDPIEVKYHGLADALRQHQDVLEVTEEPAGLDTRWSFILK